MHASWISHLHPIWLRICTVCSPLQSLTIRSWGLVGMLCVTLCQCCCDAVILLLLVIMWYHVAVCHVAVCLLRVFVPFMLLRFLVFAVFAVDVLCFTTHATHSTQLTRATHMQLISSTHHFWVYIHHSYIIAIVCLLHYSVCMRRWLSYITTVLLWSSSLRVVCDWDFHAPHLSWPVYEIITVWFRLLSSTTVQLTFAVC